MSGTLFIVATPIGNLDDLTPRAREALHAVDLIAAEDTRHTGRLLSHFGIKTPQIALHEHNEERVAQSLIERLAAGQSVALVSDAGTPLISDPGYRLVRAAHVNGITISPVPGVSAITAALSVCGLPTDRFAFEGFLPPKRKARRERLAALRDDTRSLVFYESVHRLDECLTDLSDTLGPSRAAFLGRELTKLHEQCVAAPLAELRSLLAGGSIPQKGEFVLIVAGARRQAATAIDVDRLLAALAVHLPGKVVARVVADATGQKRNALYQRLLELTAGDD